MKRKQIVNDYAIGGALAALFYIEPIETHDLDVFVSLPETKGSILTRERVYQHLAVRGYKPEGEHVLIEGVPVQFLVASSPLVEEAMEEARRRAYGAESVKVMGPEHLLAIMAELDRPKDRIRISLFLDQSEFDKRRLGEILGRHGLKKKWDKIMKEIGGEKA